MPPETPSPLFDEMLRVLRAVEDGQAPAEQLLAMVAELVPRFQAARDQTRQQLVEQGAAHLQKFAEPVQQLESAFQEVEQALKALETYAKSGKPEDARRAEAHVIRSAWSQQVAMDNYQQAELRDGPTEMPLTNLLIRMQEGFVAGRVPRNEFETAVRGAIRMAGEAQDELRQQPQMTPALEAMIGSYESLIAALNALLGAIPDGPWEEPMKGVLSASEGVRGAMMELNTRVLTAGPTPLEHHNLVLNIAAAHRANQVPDHVLVNALGVFRQGMEQERSEVEGLLSLPTSSSAVGDQAARTRMAYDLHLPAIEAFESYAAGAAERYDEARQALIAAAEALAQCREAFQQIGELEGKVLCVKCGAGNDPSARACSKCGARMVQQAGMETSTMAMSESGGEAGDGLVMTENLLRLFESVNQVAEGRLSGEEFTEILSWMEGLVQEHLLGIPAAPTFPRENLKPEELEQIDRLEEDLAQQRELVSEGAEELLTALNRLHCFLEDEDREHLITGVQMTRDAAIKIQKAQRAIDAISATVQPGAEAGEAPEEEEQEGSPVV